MGKILKLGIEKKTGYMYIVYKDGNIYRHKPLSEDEQEAGLEPDLELIKELKFKREKGYLYYIDRDGDISRIQMPGYIEKD